MARKSKSGAAVEGQAEPKVDRRRLPRSAETKQKMSDAHKRSWASGTRRAPMAILKGRVADLEAEVASLRALLGPDAPS